MKETIKHFLTILVMMYFAAPMLLYFQLTKWIGRPAYIEIGDNQGVGTYFDNYTCYNFKGEIYKISHTKLFFISMILRTLVMYFLLL